MARVDRSAYRRYRAPREDGQTLLDPGWDRLAPLVAQNRELAAGLRHDFGGMPLQELRNAARFSLLFAAEQRMVTDALERPLILSGHQPELFHPGVWFKNFVLDRVARDTGARGINLVIDSDLCRAPSVRVPTGRASAPRVEAVPFDVAAAPLPFEQRGVLDAAVLGAFPARVAECLSGLIEAPLVTALWPEVMAAAGAGRPLGAALSVARHALERSWGLANSEASLGAVCDTWPFRWFALDVMRRLDDFHRAHNQALAEYRRAHKIRTPAQPIPDLHTRGGWLEAPFWVWTDDQPERRALFARASGDRLLLSDLRGREWALPNGGSFDAAAGELAGLRYQQGVKIRSRALVTTLYARLLLADLFIHGIGGAKYDQATDRMAELFYGFAPPPHATATATLRLPIDHQPFDQDRERGIRRELRSLKYHPEKHIESPDAAAQRSIDAKRRWVSTEKTPGNAAERHRRITDANEALQPRVADCRQRLLAEQSALADRQLAARLLESREYAYCLYPSEWLRQRMASLLP